MSMFAVVPILPTLTSLLLLLPALLLSVLTAIASLRHPAVLGKVLRLVWRQKFALLLIGLGLTGDGVGGAIRDSLADAARFVGRVCGSGLADGQGQPDPVRLGAGRRESRPRGGRVGRRPGWRVVLRVPGGRGKPSGLCWIAGRCGADLLLGRPDGTRQWTAAPPDYRATFSSPVISGSYLLCGEGLHHARQARVVCLDLRPPRAGRVAWTFQTNGHVECTPAVAGDRVYVGAGDDGIYCLRLDPSVPDEQRVVWHAPGSRYPDAETALAVSGGKVYVGLGVGGNALCVLDAETGVERARIPLPYPVFSPPAIDGGKLFVGMGVGDYVRPVDQPAGSVCCLDLAR